MMMKKVMILFLVFAMAFSIADARKKKSKAGEIKDGVYTDNKYGFSLDIPDTWDASVKKDDSKVRLILVKKQFDIPNEYRHAPTYTQAPRVTVYVDTTSMPEQMFLDSLLSDQYKSDQKNEMLQDFKLLFGDVTNIRRTKMKIGDIEGALMTGERRYSINVQRQGIDGDRADLVTNYYAGSLFVVKKGDDVIIFHFICEKNYFAAEYMDFEKLLKGFKFVK
jgi:hypothetical protein